MTSKINNQEKNLVYVEDSKIHGKGLFASTAIKTGEYIGLYEGIETAENGMHVLWSETDDGGWIGRDGNNELRYLNHNKKPCAEFDGFQLFALQTIKIHQEITIDYGEEP